MNQAQKKILIVDDDDEIRELLEFDVAQSGYFVDTAKDGLEGLNKALYLMKFFKLVILLFCLKA